MRLVIGSVGRLKDGPENMLFERYAERIPHMGRSVNIGPFSLQEISENKSKSAEERARLESKALLEKLPDGAHIVALDERGRSLTTAEFADFLAKQREDACSCLAFAIGGPDGHGPQMREHSHRTLSLSAMTLPHGLARVILAEQIYRALTILAGHPYHRD